MNKKLKKRLLIIIGLILIVLNYIINYSKDNIFEAILMMPIIALVEPYGSRGILFIFGISFLAWGLIIKEENVSRTADNKKNSIIKYKIMRLFGYVPFIGILCAAFFLL